MAIPQTFDEAFARVKELVAIFRENEERYLSSGYSEAQARPDFIDSRTERDQTFYESKCATLDRQIDNLVYELYELTDDEIAIVEDKA